MEIEPVTAVYIGRRTLFRGPDELYYVLHENADDKVIYCEQIGDWLDLNLFLIGIRL